MRYLLLHLLLLSNLLPAVAQENLDTAYNLSADPLQIPFSPEIFEEELSLEEEETPEKAEDLVPETLSMPTHDKIFVDFVGSGDIQKSISEGTDINANTGVGVIFERIAMDKEGNKFDLNRRISNFELEGIINIATTSDTIATDGTGSINQRDFGVYVLNPVSKKQSLYINSNIFFGFPKLLVKGDDGKEVETLTGWGQFAKYISGVNIRVISSNNVWQNNGTSINLGVLSLRTGVFHEFFPENYRLTNEGRIKYSLFLGLNYTSRFLFGDVTSEKNNSFRRDLLGTSQTSFKGIEANFGFRLNNLRAEFQMPFLRLRNEPVDGLTNTQFLFSIRFVGGFSLKLKE